MIHSSYEAREARLFVKDVRVRSKCKFHRGCPPGKEVIPKGLAGVVVRSARREIDQFFPSRELYMVTVSWEDGVTSDASSELLDIVDEKGESS